MIPRSAPHIQPLSWREEFSRAYRDVDNLLDFLGLPRSVFMRGNDDGFPFLVPQPFAKRMRRGDLTDPLLRQVLPSNAEAQTVTGFVSDPVGDLSSRKTDGLLQKYTGRALLILSGGCVVNCRYCFRRHFPYAVATGGARIDAAFAQLIADPTISELILSGGDPLTLDDDRIEAIIKRCEQVPHLRRLRIHTRLPVMIPSRLTERLVQMLLRSRLKTSIVVHINHPNEIDRELSDALQSGSAAGLIFLNQSVLLGGVNDSAETLSELCEKLFDVGVLPYYVHELDRVDGAAHFAVERTRLMSIANSMRARLPGYLMPRFVVEVPGASSKTPLA